MRLRIAGVAPVFICLCLWWGNPAYPEEDPLLHPSADQILETADFYLVARPNYAGSYWILRQDDDDLIGYAPYDSSTRRWTLFSLKGGYHGFIQAVIGDEENQYFTHLLWYGKDNGYKGLFVSRLGGRPITPDLPYGELGGERLPYLVGNIPMALPSLELELDPLKRFPEGVDVSPVKPPSQE